METIRKLSYSLRTLFLFALAFLPVLFIYDHFILNNQFYGVFTKNGLILIHLDKHQQHILTFLNLIPLLIQMYMAWCFYILFGLYQKGKLFVAQSIRLIRRIGINLLFILVSQPLTQSVMGLLLKNPNSEHVDLFSITTGQITLGIISLVVILVSWIMKEAGNIKQENESFI